MIGRQIAVGLLVLPCVSASASAGDLTATSVMPAKLVLQQRDVGAAYVQNKSFSRVRTLKDAGSGDSLVIRRRLKQLWLGGYQTGLNGRTVPWGIVSAIDVFRGSRLTDIEHAWKDDALRLTGGRALAVPSAAPGSFRLLVRGHVVIGGQPAEIELYMWQRSRTIASLTVSGQPGSFATSLIMSLANRQDAKIRRAGYR